MPLQASNLAPAFNPASPPDCPSPTLLTSASNTIRSSPDIAEFPHLERWYGVIQAWPAVARAVKVGEEERAKHNLAEDKEAQKILFGQRAR